MTITEDVNANSGVTDAEEIDSETGRSTVPEILSNEEEQSIQNISEEIRYNNNTQQSPLALQPSLANTKCWFLPHGSYSLIPAVLATIGWLACLSKDACDYARLTGPSVAEITNNPNLPFIDVGLTRYREPQLNQTSGQWYFDLNIECELYNTDVVNFDAAWNFAKVASFISLMLGGAASMLTWFPSCYIFNEKVWRWPGYELLVATFFQSLTFVWFANGLCKTNDCQMAYSARADIIAASLWAVATLSILCKYPTVKSKHLDESNSNRRQPSPTEVEMSNQQQSEERDTSDERYVTEQEII